MALNSSCKCTATNRYYAIAWFDRGAQDTATRAHHAWKEMLNNYQQPVLDPARKESLEACVARRKEQIKQTAAS